MLRYTIYAYSTFEVDKEELKKCFSADEITISRDGNTIKLRVDKKEDKRIFTPEEIEKILLRFHMLPYSVDILEIEKKEMSKEEFEKANLAGKLAAVLAALEEDKYRVVKIIGFWEKKNGKWKKL